MKRIVLITGVSGGIGIATARAFLKDNWKVIGVDLIHGNGIPPSMLFIQSDISDLNAIKVLFRELSEKEGRMDALVNNAAIQICKPFMKTTVEDWDSTINVNLRSVFLTVQGAFPLLKKSGGAVINVSSVHAFSTSSGMSAYAASKGGLIALTREMALELAEDNIRVNAVVPGAVDTPMLRSGLDRGHLKEKTINKQLNQLGNRHPIGRIAKPDEVAQAILFLADQRQSSFITGTSLVVDGGATARLSTE